MRSFAIIGLLGLCTGCISGDSFWSYVIDDPVDKPIAQRESGTRDSPPLLSPYNVKVVYNDGAMRTEVLVPVLTSGQQIVVDHKGGQAFSGLSVLPLAPVKADRTIEEQYLQQGLPLSRQASPVSIVKSHQKIRELVRSGNFALALEYADNVLERYPKHVKTLTIKGSLLLKMGEKDAALETYRKAQDIQPDRRVEALIRKLEAGNR